MLCEARVMKKQEKKKGKKEEVKENPATKRTGLEQGSARRSRTDQK